MAQETQTGLLSQPRGVGWEGDRREVQKGGNICEPIADSCWGLTETTNSVKQLSFNKNVN